MLNTVTSARELRTLYPFLEEGVEAIRAKSPQVTEIAADVYAAILSHQADMVVMTDGDRPWGWSVYHIETESTGDRVLRSWMSYIRNGAPSAMLRDLLDGMHAIAVSAEADRISFTTTRPAWGRKLAPDGYKVMSLVFEKEVDHG